MAERAHHAEATSERIAAEPGGSAGQQLIYRLHLASYDFAASYAEGRRVLDLGCGSGYGAARLAPRCEAVVGVDVSGQAIAAAAERYRAPNLSFRTIEPTESAPLPFADSSFDVVLSFQVIEHVADPVGYLAEAKRVLAGGGVMILATPDRATRLYRGQRPWNRFHLHEYTPDEFAALLRSVFATVEVYGMGGSSELLAPELRRTARLRLATIPFTFPGAPEKWRRFGLDSMTRLRAVARPAGDRPGGMEGAEMSSGGVGTQEAADRPDATAADTEGVQIGPGVDPSVCIVAVVRPAPA